jgi:hypothetical protein
MLRTALLAALIAILVSTTAAAVSCRQCPSSSNATGTSFPSKVAEIFDPFSATQLDQIAAYVRTKLKLLAETPSDTIRGNYLYSVDWMPDEKSKVLTQLDVGKSLPPKYAGRFAKAVVFHLNNDSSAFVTEYRVGPIAAFPVVSSVPVTALTWPANYRYTTRLPATMRPTFSTEYVLMENVVSAAMAQLTNLTTVSFGVNYSTGGDFYWTDSSPRGYTNKTRQSWIWFVWAREGMYALPIGLSMLIDHKPMDDSKWKVLQLSYGGQGPFNSVQQLAAAFNRGNLTITKYSAPKKPTASAPLFSSMRRRGAQRPLESKPAPKVVQEGGPRYVVKGRQVQWMSWDLHIGFELIAGIRFNDIRFRGQRIIYELALQDAYASYSGTSPIQSLSQYSDAGWGMGWTGRALMIGVDCPAFATLFSTDFFVAGAAGSNTNNICVWEQPDDIAIMRHYDNDFWGGSGGYTSAAAVPRTNLVIRTTATVYNYDYYFNYIFYADGTIKVEAMASGYLQSDFRPQSVTLRNAEKTFQSVVNTFTSGNVHDHMFHYKVDLDVNGALNSLMASRIKVGTFNVPWNFDGQLRRQKYVERVMVEREGVASTYSEDNRVPTTFMFVNESRLNKWGATRGYGIHVGSGIWQLLDDTPWMPSLQWTKYNVAVTQRKDSEPKSGYPLYDMQGPANPILLFDSLLNNELLKNQDLVAWVMIGNHHIPTAEDIPVTTTAHTGVHFHIRPMNYFDESAVTDLSTRFYKTGTLFPDTTESFVDTVNTPMESRCIDSSPIVPLADSPPL